MSKAATERDLRIVELRRQGLTLQEIAESVGLTRERVRQVINRVGGPTADDVREGRRLQRKSADAELAGRVRDLVLQRPGMTLAELAECLGTPLSSLGGLIPEEVRSRIVASPGGATRTFTDEQIVKAIREAATFHFPLSAKAYTAVLATGAIKGPSVVRIQQRFGNWRAACELAGVESGRVMRTNYQSRWTDTDLLAFVRQYLAAPGSRGTFAGYDQWRRGEKVDAPSAPLIRNRLGQWNEVKRRAFGGAFPYEGASGQEELN